jgi:glutamate synthase domain-containing protein 3
MTMTGSAGQSFGAFALPGMRLVLVGDANDGCGKGMHGGEIVVSAAARERGRARQVLVGNSALYGATGGRVFIGGAAGERFAIRNSGATAVVEGVGDHACEYMTGGAVVILDRVGRNFGAGMTGGVAFVAMDRQALMRRIDPRQLTIDAAGPAAVLWLRDILQEHERKTGSRVARRMLRNDWQLSMFWRVAPIRAAAPAVDADEVALAINE